MTTSGYLAGAEQDKRPESDSEPRSVMDSRQHQRLLHELLVERFGPTRTAWKERP